MESPAMVPVVKAALTYQRKVLLLRRSETSPAAPGIWEFPGGKIEYGEQPASALLREIEEETGLRAEAGPILYASSFMRGSHQLIIITYQVRALSNNVRLSQEHCGFLWAGKSQLRQNLQPNILSDLNRFRALVRLDVEE